MPFLRPFSFVHHELVSVYVRHLRNVLSCQATGSPSTFARPPLPPQPVNQYSPHASLSQSPHQAVFPGWETISTVSGARSPKPPPLNPAPRKLALP